ncbi:hypothetical protein [Candidatus Mesenet endosymbiont of Phosphuga atrata]|uniref:hypothetical protein n=1 Tax=Candidatus Mesenet endosymbiont of Phosphuga atrata TaxID=3066221 RepID=UPI0030D52F0F
MSTSKKITIGPFNEDYRKLIMLPTASYLLEQNRSNEYTIHALNGNVQIKDKDKLKLKWENDKIVLHDGSSALKLNGQDFTVEQDAIISKNKDDIIEALKSGGIVDVTVESLSKNIGSNSTKFGIGLSFYNKMNGNLPKGEFTGLLNFINFSDEDDQILQEVVKKTDGLYFTTKEEGTCCSEITCISDKNGTCVSMYGKDEHYQFKLTAVDTLVAVDSLIKDKQDLSAKLSKVAGSTKKLAHSYASLKEFSAEVVKGDEISFGKYAANIKLEDKDIAGAFSKVGYYFFDNAIYIYDHFAKDKDSFSLPEHFHFLKVVKDEKDHYKLAFCNSSGHEYYSMPDDYKLINIEHIKGIKNIDFAKYHVKNGSFPSFIAKPNVKNYAGSKQHKIDIYEIENENIKVGSLIDEFGYYDSQNKFHYTNNQIGVKDHYYDLPSFTIAAGDNKCESNTIKEGSNILNANHLNPVDCNLVEYIANHINDYATSHSFM